MKTNNVLIENERYANGSIAYKGSVLSTYGATLEITANAQINVSNAGRIMCSAEDKLQSARKKLRRGQIGARKQESVQLGGTQLIKDVVAEVNDLNTAAEVTDLPSNSDLNERLNTILTYKEGEETFSYLEVLEARKRAGEENQTVRNNVEAIKLKHNYRVGQKMSTTLMEEIATEMKKLLSITGIDMVVTLKCKHVINTKGNYVNCSDKEALNQIMGEADYPVQGNRLVAGRTVQKLIIPIQSLEQIKQVKEFISSLVIDSLDGLQTSEILTEDTNPEIDFKALKEADSKVKSF